MPNRDPATGRYTSGGGGGGGSGTQLGSAYGKIIIDGSGVQAGVQTAVDSLDQLSGRLNRVTGLMSGAVVAGATAVSVALGAVVGSGVRMAASLEEQLSNIQAAMRLSEDQIDLLENKILELGVDPTLKVSTLEAAAAIEALGKNGLTTQQILDGAAYSTVLLANSTGAEFGPAANIATDAMRLFNIQAKDMIGAVDGITSVVNGGKFKIDDYRLALAQAGGVASVIGVSFDDFNASINAIAPLFGSGSDAGTSFKNMLTKLAAPADAAKDTMRALGLVTADGKNQFFTATGELKSMAEVAGLLQTAMAGLTKEQQTQALTTIFGSDAIRAAAGLAQMGEAEFRKLQETMGQTSAVDAAAIRMDNLAGSLEILRGVIDTIRIRIGKSFLAPLKMMVDGLSDVLSRNADRIANFFRVLATLFTGFLGVARAFLGALSARFSANFGDMGKKAEGYGRNITISLARGMISAAVAVVRALNIIGQTITHWLQPHSPPLLLPDLDLWGAGAMDVYLEGWTQADFSIFDDLGRILEKHLRDIAPEDSTSLVPNLLGMRQALADLITQVRATGAVGVDTFTKLEEITGPLPETVRNYAKALLELEAANTAVNQAQEQFDALQSLTLKNLDSNSVAGDDLTAVLQDIAKSYVEAAQGQELAFGSYGNVVPAQEVLEKLAAAQAKLNNLTNILPPELATAAQAYVQALAAQQTAVDAHQYALNRLAQANERVKDAQENLNAVTDAYSEKLAPLNEELQALRDRQQDMRDEKRLGELRKVLADEEATAADKAQAQLELDEILIQQKIRAVQKEQQAAVDAAQAQLDAAKAAQDAAQEQVNSSQDAVDAANSASDAQQAALLALAQAQVDAAQAQQTALNDQVSLYGSIIGVQQENNDLVQEQIDLLDKLASKIDEVVSDVEEKVSDMGGDLGPSFDRMGEDLSDSLNGALDDVGGGLGDSIANNVTSSIDQLVADVQNEFTPLQEAATELGTTWGDTFKTISDRFGEVVQFVQDHSEEIKGALAGIGLLLASSAVAGAITAAIAAILNPIVLLVAGVGLLGAAWEGNWGGIRDTAVSVVDTVKEKLGLLSDWFETNKEPIMAFVNGTLGSLLRKWEQVAISIGTFVVEQFKKVGNWFTTNRPLIEAFATNVGIALGALAAAFVWLATHAQEALIGMWFIVEPLLGGVVDIVLSVATAIMQIVTGDWAGAWESLKAIPGQAWEAIKLAFGAFLDWVTSWFGSSWEEVTTTWSEDWALLGEIVNAAWENMKTAVSDYFTQLWSDVATKIEAAKLTWTNNWNAIKTIATTIWDNIKTAILEKVRALFTAMGLDLDEMSARWSQIWQDVWLIVTTVWDNIKTTVSDKFEELKTTFGTKLEELKTAWEEKWASFKDKAVEVWENIVTAVGDKVGELKTALAMKLEELRTMVGEKWQRIKDKADEIWENLKSSVTGKMEELKTSVTTKIDEIWTWIHNQITPFYNLGASLIDGLIDGTLSMAGQLLSAITGMIEDVLADVLASLGLGDGGGGGNTPQNGTPNNATTNAANYTTNAGRSNTASAVASAYSNLATMMELAARVRSSASQLPELANTAANGRAPITTPGKQQTIYQAHIYGPVTISDVQEPNEFLRALTKLSFGEKQ